MSIYLSRSGRIAGLAAPCYWAAIVLCACASAAVGAETQPAEDKPDKAEAAISLSADQRDAIDKAGLKAGAVAPLVDKPLYKFTEAEVDTYLRYLRALEPDLRKRIAHLARKNVKQPYELYLLGEMPFETYDPQPLYCLGKSDCVVFAEHTYAMALAHDWPSFMAMLQRIRYRDGQIGVATRNHYTEADWNVSNRWLVEDITGEIAGEKGVKFEQKVDRASFLKSRYGLEVEAPVETHRDVYLPASEITRAATKLHDGDFVNIVRGVTSKTDENGKTFGGSAYVGHVGLVVVGDDGNMNLIHSIAPAVREEPFVDFIAKAKSEKEQREKEGKPVLLGFKFLRLNEKPLENLRKIDGDEAPRVTFPHGGAAKF